MSGMGGIFFRVLAVSAGCSAVLGPLLLLAPWLQRRVRAQSFYVLFLLLAIRLSVPVEPGAAVRPAVRVDAPQAQIWVPAASTGEALTVEAQAGETGTAPWEDGQRPDRERPDQAVGERRGRTVPVADVLGLVWLGGVCLRLLWAAGSYGAARRRLLGHSAPAREAQARLLDELRRRTGVRRQVGLRLSARTGTPLALGLAGPVIVLPQRAYGDRELALVLRHELAHIRRWDAAYKLALYLACAVNWFNPLVWLMARAAERNLELCCDDEVVRGLSREERRLYGGVLLEEAQAARPTLLSTGFSGGKGQLKLRLANLFARKRGGAALVCLVLAAAVLAGGLVAYGGGEAGGPRRRALEDYFTGHFDPGRAGVVLADVTGDGQEELLVLTMADEEGVDRPLDQPVAAEAFYRGRWQVFGVDEEGAVFPFPEGEVDISSSHAGWGYLYLIPQGEGWAFWEFRPYVGQGRAEYACSLFQFDRQGRRTTLEESSVGFLTDPDSLMGRDTGADAGTGEVERFLLYIRQRQSDGTPLLAYYADYDIAEGGTQFAYLRVDPERAFGGAAMDGRALGEYVVDNRHRALFPLPEREPDSPEEALDRLEETVQIYPGGVVFRLPDYSGTWRAVQLSGRARMDGPEDAPGDEGGFMSVHYLDPQQEEWVPGRRYEVETGSTWFDELTLWAQVQGPDGTQAERAITLVRGGILGADPVEESDWLEKAMDALERSIRGSEAGFAFTLPDFAVQWDVKVEGRVRMDKVSHPADVPEPLFMPVRYLENTVWKSGQRYSFETGSAWFEELTLWVRVEDTLHGTARERTILLAAAGSAPGDWGGGTGEGGEGE